MNERTNRNPHSTPFEILMTDLPKGTIIPAESDLGVSRTFATDDIRTDNFRSFYYRSQSDTEPARVILLPDDITFVL